MQIEFDDQTLDVTAYTNKQHLEQIAPKVLEQVRESVFKEFDPMWARAAEQSPGTIIHGDVIVQEENFFRIYDQLEDPGRFLIVTGNLEVRKAGLAIEDTDRLVVLGDLEAQGVSNWCGELHVHGRTRIPGGLFFDSNDGGFTSLRLAEPVGFIAATANVFDITPMAAKYYFDPSFECGFDGTPTNPHEEIIQHAFTNSPKLVTAQDLAAFLRDKAGSEEAAQEVLDGEHWEWIREVFTNYDSRAFVAYFDERL